MFMIIEINILFNEVRKEIFSKEGKKEINIF